MTPAVGEIPDVAEEYTTGFGVRKLVWFKTLKNSARNWMPSPSVMCALLAAEKSTSVELGPTSESRETLPYVPAAGGRKAAGLNHCPGVRG